MVINVKDSNRSHYNAKMMEVVRKVRENGIYPIARIVVFQDNELASARPDLSLRDKEGNLWGKSEYHFVDASSREVWEYNLKAAKDALRMGFLEVNLDYIHFPDGNVDSIVYPAYNGKTPKKDIINEFSRFIMTGIHKEFPQALVSANIFAYTLLDLDVGIGQDFLDLMQIYDVVAPMIYPSHYTAGNFGFKNPAEHPYEVVKETLLSGKRMLMPDPVVAASSTASSSSSTMAQVTPQPILIKAEMRPWIQDFDMGAYYTKEMIEAQVKAIEDVGYHAGWMSWNPRVNYIPQEYIGL